MTETGCALQIYY